MQLGIVGLGRMGANIARRLMRAGHACVVYDRDPEPGRRLQAEGALAAGSFAELVANLTAPRAVWIMLPAGAATESAIAELSGLLAAGDTIIDGGNTFWKDDVRRARELKAKGLHYLDVGTSGGVWGLERGYCLMIGGEKAAVERLDPIFAALAPGKGSIAATPGRSGRDARVEQGYLHAGPSGAGHFVKMIHNGIEYGMMQAIAEGFDILKHANSPRLPEELRLSIDVADVAEVWRRGSVDHLVAARSYRGGAGRGQGAVGLLRPRGGFRRGPLDGAGGHRGGGAGGGADERALHALPLAPGSHVRREGALCHAQGLRRARGARQAMSAASASSSC